MEGTHRAEEGSNPLVCFIDIGWSSKKVCQKFKQKEGKEMKKKILDYLSDQEMQHRDLAKIYYDKYKRAHKMFHKNVHYTDYKKHKEAASVLSKAAVVVNTIDKMEKERGK